MTNPGWEHIAATIARVQPERRMRIETCVCGGQIRADRYDPMSYVAAHNRTNLHRAWRERNGL